MPSKIQVDQIAGATGSTVTLPSGQTLDLSSGTVTLPSTALSALNASNLTSGTVPSARLSLTSSDLPTVPTTKGGTGLTTIGTAGQALKVNSGATGLEFGTLSSKFVKATLGYTNSTRTVYSASDVNVTGQDFEHPTGALQTISFTKDSATSNIIIHFCLNVGIALSQHSGLLFSTADSVYRHFSYDGSRNGASSASTGSDQFIGQAFFSGLSAGSKTFYITLGRNDDNNGVGWTLNPDLNDSSDKSLTPTSTVIIYEIEP
jgi:hypothetical protein